MTKVYIQARTGKLELFEHEEVVPQNPRKGLGPANNNVDLTKDTKGARAHHLLIDIAAVRTPKDLFEFCKRYSVPLQDVLTMGDCSAIFSRHYKSPNSPLNVQCPGGRLQLLGLSGKKVPDVLIADYNETERTSRRHHIKKRERRAKAS